MLTPTPFEMTTLLLRSAQLIWETQTVITLRMLGMVGVWKVHPNETSRMVLEKGPAFARSAARAQAAVLRGKRPDEVILAAIDPLTHKTRKNRKRLTRRRK